MQPAPTAPSSTAPDAPSGRRPANRALLGVAAAALTVIVGLGAWALSGDDSKGKTGGTGGVVDPGKTSAPPKPAVTKLPIQRAAPAERPVGGHHDSAIGKNPGAVIDGKAATTWETQSYADTSFGNFSKGLGVLLDMGKPVKVSTVKVASPESGGALQVRVGNSQSPTELSLAGRGTASAGETTITAEGQATGRYVLVWFVKLPSSLKGKIGEIAVYGSAN
ncbi:hypothetical protein E1298_23425 [Actinomadura rubrisoli]|uniref:Discoidin domain-containing protein n=1 Tax=Actinomadura rubrisoli TaxID=2530368 RepID=A0A4R5B7R9_9ACTN|nr:hypothetical protein E1298_23425 [Actinomadura rubrisoli]